MSRDYVLPPFRAPVELQIDYAQALNPQQLAAVTAPPGPALVIAGAGAGKTRTLVYRVAYLLEQGVPARNILLLTFTNKAAHEMMRRVNDLLAHDTASLWGGTFHAIGNRLLRTHAERLGFLPDFTILDREDARDLINTCLGEAKLDVKGGRFPKADVLAEMFSLAANTGHPLRQVLASQFDYFESIAEAVENLAARYAARKREGGVVDFDDLLTLWLRLFREHPDLCEHYQRRFLFVLVDEYQDTNHLQGQLIDLLATRHDNLMVVGDDAQSIYSWRGADFQNILQFAERHPRAQVFRIETNYRSSPEILAVANAAIAPNVRQHAKRLVPVRLPGPKPALVLCLDAYVQARFIAQRALELREEGIELSEMAVLYRSHFHALELQLELSRRNVPFSITSGIRFFEQAHIKDVAAYLRFAANPRDELAFKRVVRLLPGVGPKAAGKLWTHFHSVLPASPDHQPSRSRGAAETEVSWAAPPPEERTSALGGEAMPAPVEFETEALPIAPPAWLGANLQAIASSVPKKTAVAWAQLSATLAQLVAAPVWGRSAEMIQLVVDAGYEEYLQESYINFRARLEDVQQLGVFAQRFSTLPEFLSQLALLTNLEAEADAETARDSDRLRLSTIHQAKGLEFTVVFLIMLCDGMLPSRHLTENLEGLEEERRLFYVAVTRAKRELYLSYPRVRMARGGGAELWQQPSRFLADIPRELIEEWNLLDAAPL